MIKTEREMDNACCLGDRVSGREGVQACWRKGHRASKSEAGRASWCKGNQAYASKAARVIVGKAQ